MPKDPTHLAIMPLGDHLEDLRRRVILALVGLIPLLVIGLLLGRQLLDWLLIPARVSMQEQDLVAQLQTLSPAEAFYAWMKIATVFTIVIGAPWVIYQLWKFIAPGLYAAERRFAYVLAPLSAILSIISVAFVFFVILPVVLAFFIHFGSTIGAEEPFIATMDPGVVLPTVPVIDGDVREPAPGQLWMNSRLKQLRLAVADDDGEVKILGIPLSSGSVIAQQYRLSEYVRMVLTMMLGFAVAFQMPVAVLLLGWARLVTPAFLRKYRRHALLVLAAISAVLTPADPLSMLLMAAPLYLLYELGILLMLLLTPRRIAGKSRESGDGSETRL